MNYNVLVYLAAYCNNVIDEESFQTLIGFNLTTADIDIEFIDITGVES